MPGYDAPCRILPPGLHSVWDRIRLSAVRQAIKLAIDQNLIDEGSHGFPIGFSSVEILSFRGPINH
jgi:hypothetical protein